MSGGHTPQRAAATDTEPKPTIRQPWAGRVGLLLERDPDAAELLRVMLLGEESPLRVACFGAQFVFQRPISRRWQRVLSALVADPEGVAWLARTISAIPRVRQARTARARRAA